MSQFVVRMNEWFFTQGLVGYKKILENYGEQVRTTEDGIIIEKKHLEQITDAFFHYYFKKYSVAEREEKKIRRLHKQFKNGDKGTKKEINTNLNEIKNKVKRDFSNSDEGKILIEVVDRYRKEKNYHPDMDQWLETFFEMLHKKDIDQKLTANFFKAVHLNPYFGQVSFLNVTNNKKSIDEQKEIFYQDFVLPVLEEFNIYFALEDKDEKQVMEILNKIESEHLKSLVRALKKQKVVDEMKEYIEENIHKCALSGFPIAIQNFEEKIFSPLALSVNKAINMTWNANGKQYLPISSLARLILFCSHAGATMSQGNSVFVYYAGSFDEIYQTNQFYSDMKSGDRTFDEIIFDLVREQKLRADFLERHYLIYEYTSEYQTKKTLLDYMVMTPHVAKLFLDHSNLFQNLYPSQKSEMVRLLLKGIDSKHYINRVLREKVKNLYSSYDVIQMILIRHLNQVYAKGDFMVDSKLQKSYIWALVKSAEEVRRQINNDKKAQGIAYRLLNAVRSNDKNTFMDTVMRTYISYDLEMPGLLLEALHEDKLDFATVGNAWIAGLISKSNNGNEVEEEETYHE